MKVACIVSDNMDDAMLQRCLIRATGFVYVMSSVTTTGSDHDFFAPLEQFIQRLKKQSGPTKRLVVGFGIKTADHVKRIKNLPIDGFIIGSEIVRQLGEGGVNQLKAYLMTVLDS